MIAEYVVPIVAIIVLVFLNGLFVAAEFALVGARVGRLEALAEDGSRAAQWLVDIFRRHAGKDSYIAVAQLGITLASIGLGMYGEPAVAHWLYEPLEDLGVPKTASHTVGFIIALSAITYMHVVFGEMIPKALALQSPEGVSVRLNPVMRFFSALFKPMVTVLNAIAFALMRLLRIPEPDKRLSLHTSSELAIVSDESAHSGQLAERQRDLIRNIFELDERPAEEIMISRPNIVAIDQIATATEITERIGASMRSRYPVVDGDLDHVVGMLHIKDFIRSNRLGTFTSLAELVRPLPVVAATTSADELLEQFKQGNNHAALVVDEFGATVGFVSLDDVIAEIMVDEPSGVIARHTDGSISVSGETPLADLRTWLDDPAFDHEDIVTIAGLVLADNGEVPFVGTSVHHGGYDLVVEQLDGRKITRVRLRPTEDDGAAEPGEAPAH
jgi:CBS domain containing-hemolysin-like protein